MDTDFLTRCWEGMTESGQRTALVGAALMAAGFFLSHRPTRRHLLSLGALLALLPWAFAGIRLLPFFPAAGVLLLWSGFFTLSVVWRGMGSPSLGEIRHRLLRGFARAPAPSGERAHSSPPPASRPARGHRGPGRWRRPRFQSRGPLVVVQPAPSVPTPPSVLAPPPDFWVRGHPSDSQIPGAEPPPAPSSLSPHLRR